MPAHSQLARRSSVRVRSVSKSPTESQIATYRANCEVETLQLGELGGCDFRESGDLVQYSTRSLGVPLECVARYEDQRGPSVYNPGGTGQYSSFRFTVGNALVNPPELVSRRLSC